MYDITKYEQVNVAGTSLLYDLLARSARHGVERIVVASSRAIDGEGAHKCREHGLVYPDSRSNNRFHQFRISIARNAGALARRKRHNSAARFLVCKLLEQM